MKVLDLRNNSLTLEEGWTMQLRSVKETRLLIYDLWFANQINDRDHIFEINGQKCNMDEVRGILFDIEDQSKEIEVDILSDGEKVEFIDIKMIDKEEFSRRTDGLEWEVVGRGGGSDDEAVLIVVFIILIMGVCALF